MNGQTAAHRMGSTLLLEGQTKINKKRDVRAFVHSFPMGHGEFAMPAPFMPMAGPRATVKR